MRLAIQFVLMVLLGLGALMISSCQRSTEDVRRERQETLARYATQAAQEMVYVRDDRTGLCFAFWWQRYDRSGSPALAAVPCDQVADRLVNR